MGTRLPHLRFEFRAYHPMGDLEDWEHLVVVTPAVTHVVAALEIVRT